MTQYPPGFAPCCGYCGRPQTVCTCGSTPAGMPTPNPTRFVKRGGYMVCVECGLTIDYCRGHSPADVPSKDGSESHLARRIAEAQGRKEFN